MLKKFFLDRLREPSTYAGVAAIGGVVGISPEILGPIGTIAMGVGGLLAILLKDKGDK